MKESDYVVNIHYQNANKMGSPVVSVKGFDFSSASGAA